jgi:hypothetical protein
VVGVVASVLLHSGIPLGGVFWRVQSVTQLPVTLTLESLPAPPAEEPDDAPDDAPDDEPDPTKPDEPTTDEPAPKQPEPDEPAPKEPVPRDAPPPEPAPAEPPPDVAEPEPVGDPPPPLDAAPDPAADLAARIAERERKRAEWLAEREKRRAERAARREARRRAQEERRRAAEAGGAPESGEQHGKPEPVYLCSATDKGVELPVRTERPLTAWMPIVPTVFAHFETRPSLDAWLRRTSQVFVPRKRLGLMDFAAPPEVMQFRLEEPRGVTIAVGRLDVRCMVGMTYRAKLFPLKLSRVPARIIDRQNHTVSALINIMIYKDASIEIEPWDARQPELPFRRGALQNSRQIARNIEDHFQAARVANALAEMFGLKTKKPKR